LIADQEASLRKAKVNGLFFHFLTFDFPELLMYMTKPLGMKASICLCYLRFAPENPEDGEMYLLVPAHPGCPGQSPQSRKMVVCVCV